MSEIAWHPEDIKAAVRKTGPTLTSLALSKGLPESACRMALLGRNRRGEIAIAEHIDIPLWELWPGRWRKSADGTAIRIDHRRKCRTPGNNRHRQMSKETLT